MDIKQQFREEKNMDVYATNVNDGSFSNVYVKWLEAKLTLTDVSSSLPTKKYEIDFGAHLRCGIDVTNNELNILGAMDGWGNGVSKDVIVIKEL